MSKIWKGCAILALVLSVATVGTVLTAQEHQDEATQEETEHDMGSMHDMDSGHDMGAMMAMMKEMMANMHEHMAMMHTMMAGKHGDVRATHGEGLHAEHGSKSMNEMKGAGMHKMQGQGMHRMQGEGGQGQGMRQMHGTQGAQRQDGQRMMKMVDPAGIEDAAKATADADKVAEHLEMMKQMMPKLEAQLEALRKRAQELSASES